MRFRTALLISVAATSACALSPAFAQTTPEGDGEIIVTAQRRAERTEDVPISITSVSGDLVEKAGITRFEDIARIAPGLTIARTGVYTQPAIRGITTALSGGENNVATYIDGVYIRSSRGLNNDLVNIASVQVLKGPQGTLFGRNATGGALLIETLQPSLTGTEGRFSATYARFDDRRLQGYVSTPLAENAAVSLLGAYRKSDGYIKDVAGFDSAPLNTYTFAAKLRWEPTDRLDLSVKLDTAKIADGRALATTITGRSLAQFLFPGSYSETRDNRTSLNHPVINRAKQYNGSVKAQYDLDWAALTSITSYQAENNYSHFETDGSAQLVYDQRFKEDYRTFQQEFNFASKGDSPLQYVLGLYYYHNKYRQYDNVTLTGPSTETRRRTEAFAAFGDLTWQATERLFLTGGLRYSIERPKQAILTGAGLLQNPGPQNPGKDKFRSATPRVVARYELGTDTNVYASYSKGFKSGFIDGIAPLFATIKPEKVDAYEVGFKTRAGTLRFDTAAFYYDYKDLQVGSVVVLNGLTQTITANAANAEIYGAEAQLSARPIDGLNLSGGVSYTHARYKDFPNATVSLPNAVGLNSSTCGRTFCTQDFSGQRIVRSPDWTVNANVDYTIPINDGSLLFAANATYTSEFSPTKSDRGLNGTGYRYLQPDTFQLNLRAAYTLPGDKWTLSVFGRNVTDVKTYAVLTGNAFGDYQVLGEPATYGVTLDFRF
ncbi:TonB-dependent receptor [Sphingomonas solaris]|uniref:TonB-dependent receptor n=1 Tax=Alterirhizorhabdus solaris TaxID=2529389 RepID=A0A558R8R3_9SPHN|nr:TonB-dependent receptor [Sphingomonas solaris]TVV75764.1 TonB-dependent receptor [Sphingomonas solaris]